MMINVSDILSYVFCKKSLFYRIYEAIDVQDVLSSPLYANFLNSYYKLLTKFDSKITYYSILKNDLEFIKKYYFLASKNALRNFEKNNALNLSNFDFYGHGLKHQIDVLSSIKLIDFYSTVLYFDRLNLTNFLVPKKLSKFGKINLQNIFPKIYFGEQIKSFDLGLMGEVDVVKEYRKNGVLSSIDLIQLKQVSKIPSRPYMFHKMQLLLIRLLYEAALSEKSFQSDYYAFKGNINLYVCYTVDSNTIELQKVRVKGVDVLNLSVYVSKTSSYLENLFNLKNNYSNADLVPKNLIPKKTPYVSRCNSCKYQLICSIQ